MIKIKYNMLPEHMRSGAKLYIERGIRPGSFLTAVLENDLRGAIQQADSTNREQIPNFLEWIYWEIPASAHGSPEKVSAWVSQGGLFGMD